MEKVRAVIFDRDGTILDMVGGIGFIRVLTGIERKEDFVKEGLSPQSIFNSIEDLVKTL